MKSYKIKVNGKSYDVTVEETGAPSSPQEAGIGRPPAPSKGVPSAPRPAPSAVSAKAAAPNAPARSGEVRVKASMPGTVIGYRVQAGAQVKAGDVILILEAMKMENEIASPVDGVLKAFVAAEGASVATGEVLAIIS
jgi:glutaconyl-CoA/methylmalonyl-CoA decarboxylase subunit gamma